MSKTHTITNKLGRITGAVCDNVVQYRGIPYASIPGRFKDPIGPLGFLGDFDGTKWGPMAVQPENSEAGDAGVMNHKLTPMPPHRRTMSELECTNLVIVTPYTPQNGEREQDSLSPTTILLPTIVWVHGGENKVGSANFMSYDMRNFVKHSIDVANKPVIVVSLNHRLGILGHLASKEVGATGNYGLKDQVMGLKWVKEHIECFGGNPDNITFMGESAGSISGSIHLYSENALFNRAILLSGLAGLLPPRPMEVQDKIYDETCKMLKIDSSSITERTERFINTPTSEFGKIAFQVGAYPTSDGEIISTTKWLGHEDFKPLPVWCDSIIIGSCYDEWSVFEFGGGIGRFKDPIESFYNRLLTVLPEASIEELFSRFHISYSDSRDIKIKKLCILIANYAFRLPAYYFTRHWTSSSKRAFFAQFKIPSPIPGPSKGLAHHGIDTVFSFQNHNQELPEKDGYRELAGEIGSMWCRYAYGLEPWKAFDSNSETVMVFDVEGRGGENRLREIHPEEWETWMVMERLGFDRVWKVGHEFLSGPGEGE